jgi:hypothetical protein
MSVQWANGSDEAAEQEAPSLRDACGEAARAIAAVGGQIDLAIRESEEPVAQMSAGVARVVEATEALMASDALRDNPDLATVRAFVHGAVEHMQFYDRMTQHLGHVYGYMMAIASRMGNLAESPELDGTPEDARKNWEELRSRFYGRLLTEPQRQLFDMMLPPDTGITARMRQRADPGSIELF